MWIALYASLAMICQDVFSALLTQAEARDMAKMAGMLDMVGWLVAIATLDWSLNAINGHDIVLKVVVIGSVSAANYIGSYSGTRLGKRWLKTKLTLEDRIAALEKQSVRGSTHG